MRRNTAAHDLLLCSEKNQNGGPYKPRSPQLKIKFVFQQHVGHQKRERKERREKTKRRRRRNEKKNVLF
ncbi:hypothetical protein ES319_A04G013500v1 [Gossypium barbadense]|uniref:Uncharacterized protein n=1 Tax=Gossypium barbadense TaxID=3634 RepID=A0A5J5W179_GOSBA|nr:hypothetical protein ES319_A04G013500v1 [Gossypium barbadense]